MEALLPIGDFSRMTYLSVKALRHYHEVGLLDPERIDPATGYRFYDPSQVSTAQVIRRLRDLGMPLEDIRAVLGAPDASSRNEVLVAHLRRMETQLEKTRATVSSLRALLERPTLPISVQYRSVPRSPALAIAERVSMDELEGWWSEAFEELYGVLMAANAEPAGPSGALYSKEFFEFELGEVVAFLPVSGGLAPSERAKLVDIPAGEFAIAVHEGSFSELDQTYGALGTFVARRELGVEGPIREYYLVSSADTDDESWHRTEVGWPVFHTTPGAKEEPNSQGDT